MPERDLPHEGGRSRRARAVGSAVAVLAGGHVPAESCPSARNKQPSDGPDHHDEVAVEEERRYLPGGGVEESRALSSRHRRAPKRPTWPGSELILLGCARRCQPARTSQAWRGLQGVLHSDLPGSGGEHVGECARVRAASSPGHLCANHAPTAWDLARRRWKKGLAPVHAKLRVRSRTTIGASHSILGALFTARRPAVATFPSSGDAGQDEDLGSHRPRARRMPWTSRRQVDCPPSARPCAASCASGRPRRPALQRGDHPLPLSH